MKTVLLSLLMLVSAAQADNSDLLSRCQSYISDLASTQRQANMVARTGNLTSASQMMYNKLVQRASQLPDPFDSTTVPHTVEAIRAGKKVAAAVMLGTQEAGSAKMLAGQVRFVALNNIYNLISSAYNNLDSPYFFPYVNVCGWCSGQLPMAYFDGVRQLAQNFLNLRHNLARVSATDITELRMTGAVAGSAKNILANSVYRRNFSCAYTNLQSIEREVQDFINNGGEIPVSWFVQDIRNRMDSVRLPAYGTCY